jgi:hypothetical protein
MLAHVVSGLRFVRGTLQYNADDVRARQIRTRITPHRDGVVVLETRGRGQAALPWQERLPPPGGRRAGTGA